MGCFFISSQIFPEFDGFFLSGLYFSLFYGRIHKEKSLNLAKICGEMKKPHMGSLRR